MRRLLPMLVMVSSAWGRCRPIEGVDKLFAPGRIILAGETHGTQEMPRLFVDLVCHAATKGFQVVVGFEQPPSAGQAIEKYLSSPGSRLERFKILEPRVHYGDGTSSEAMMDAFESLRLLAVETKRISVFGFSGKSAENGNIGYAEAIASAHQAAPGAIVLALMGSYHNRLTREEDDGGRPVGLLLRQRGLDLKSIYIEFTSGSAYMRSMDGPGIQEPTALQMGGGKPWVVLPAPSGAYDAIISVGQIHPSLPAAAPETPAAGSVHARECAALLERLEAINRRAIDLGVANKAKGGTLATMWRGFAHQADSDARTSLVSTDPAVLKWENRLRDVRARSVRAFEQLAAAEESGDPRQKKEANEPIKKYGSEWNDVEANLRAGCQ